MLLGVALLMWFAGHFISACEGDKESTVTVVLVLAGIQILAWCFEYGLGVVLLTFLLIGGGIWAIIAIMKSINK